jgi:hypothetical protein
MSERKRYLMKELAALAGIILFCHAVSGQAKFDETGIRYPAEEIQVHITQTYLFPGEVLGFKFYCTNPLFPELELSRIAFIELVSDRNTSVLRKKILLERGTGSGVFILPDNLDSGIYTVLAYTNWLKNVGEGSFHRQNILIINPEQAAPHNMDTSDNSLKYLPRQGINDIVQAGIQLIPDKNKYQAREKVTLKIKLAQDEGQRPGGVFSLSVNLTEPALNVEQHEKPDRLPEILAEDIVYLPDFRGIRLTGKIEDTYGALQGARIIISEPGPGTKIKSALSDTGGNFHFLLEPQEGEKDIVFTLPENNAMIKLEEPFWNGLRNPPVPQELLLDNGVAAYLEEKFFHLQLQQKFNQENFMQEDQLNGDMKDNERFYHHPPRIIKMDDYVLLDSLPEYFYELVPSVKYTFTRGQYDISVLDKVNLSYFEASPGVFIDGVLYSDYNQIARIPVSAINSISVLPELYFYHDFSFGGIIDLHTKQSDFSEVQLLPNMIRLVFPLAERSAMEYHAMDHSLADTPDRIPDFRYLICWEPDIIIGPHGENTIQFYTGDVSGDFIIKVIGISAQGKIVRSETKIVVGEEPANEP